MCLHAWNLLSHTYTLRNTNALTSCRLSPVSAAGYWDVRRRCTRFFLLLLLLLSLLNTTRLLFAGVVKHLSQVSTRFLRDKYSNFGGATYNIFRRMWAVPHSAISWMVSSFRFFIIFFKFPFIECGMAPNAPTMTGIVSVFVPHILVISISKFLYFSLLSASLAVVFFSAGTDTSINLHHFSALCLSMISGLLAGTVLSVWIC